MTSIQQARRPVLAAAQQVTVLRKRWTAYSVDGVDVAAALVNAVLRLQHVRNELAVGPLGQFAGLEDLYVDQATAEMDRLKATLAEAVAKLETQVAAMQAQVATMETLVAELTRDYGPAGVQLRAIYNTVSVGTFVDAMRAMVASYARQCKVNRDCVDILSKTRDRTTALQCMLAWQYEPMISSLDYERIVSIIAAESVG